MKTRVGLWIDHRKAIVVAIADKGEETRLVISAVEKQARRSKNARHAGPFEAQKARPDDIRQRAITGHLNVFYDAIIASIKDAEAILILGPGEAKVELEKRLEKSGLGGCVLGVETVDKMTEHQVAAKARERFAE
jgi:hypothetical protein